MNRKQEIGTGIFFLVLSVFYLLGSLSISTFNPFGNRGLTSKSIPQVLGGAVAFLSILHIIGNVLKLKTEKMASSDGKVKIKWGRPLQLMLISVLFICAYIFFFIRLGFILSTVLFLLAEIFLLIPPEKRKRWAIFIVCFSVGMPVLLYLLFTKSLSMFLPRGLLG